MTLPTSRPISLGQVCAEFGAPSNTALGAFVRGGAWVPNTPANSGVPTSKPISLGDLLGASAATPLSASLNTSTTSGSGVHPATVTSGIVICTAAGGTGTYTYSWVLVSGTPLTVTNPTLRNTSFSRSFPTAGSTTSVYKCTVTDSASNVVDSGTVTISLSAT